MELRKVNQVGRDTLTVSLPKLWVNENNINKGDQLKIDKHNGKLIIKTSNFKQKVENIDTENVNVFLLNKLILNAYMKNVDKIIIISKTDRIYNNQSSTEVSIFDCITNIISAYIGMEIVSHSKEKIIIQNLFEEGEISSLSIVQDRTTSLYSDFLERIIDTLESSKNFNNFQTEREILNIRKFIYHNMRLIVDSEKSTFSKIKLYVLYDHLDNSLYSIEKLIKLFAQTKRITNKVIELIKEIFLIFIKFLHMKKGIELASFNKIIIDRENLYKKISESKLNLEESKITREIEIFLNLHNDFVLMGLK